MDVVNERCAGLDVHKRTVVACVRIPSLGGGRRREKATRTFGTTMAGLEALRDWLAGYGATRVAMESTGVYWRPVYTVLESRFELMLVNARHVEHHHRFLLREQLATIDHLSDRIARLDTRIEEVTRPFSSALDLLMR